MGSTRGGVGVADIEYRRVWMIDGKTAQPGEVLERIAKVIEASRAPELNIRREVLNMWWRKDSPAIALESKLERTMPLRGAIYAQGYGTTLVVGRVVVQPDSMNRYKWMAAAAFEYLIDRCVATIVAEEDGREVTERGEKSTNTGTT